MDNLKIVQLDLGFERKPISTGMIKLHSDLHLLG